MESDMYSVQIPGICDPDAALEVKKEENTRKHKVAVDLRDGAITILTFEKNEKMNTEIYTEVQEISEEEVSQIGKKVPDSEYDENLDIHCEKCDSFYRPYCFLHPLYRIPDRDDPSPPENQSECFAMRTLPRLFQVKESKIPKAGLGVYAQVLIPRGIVFGPYKGIKCTKKSEFYKDGYAWEISTRDKQLMYVDGSDPEASNWLRYINSPRDEEEQNLLAFQTNGKVFYRVIKPIRSGEELLVWYGGKFGSSLAHTVADVRRKRERSVEPKVRKRVPLTSSNRSIKIKVPCFR